MSHSYHYVSIFPKKDYKTNEKNEKKPQYGNK